MFSCSSQCNILVLIKTNKGKHSLMGGKRKMFWSPGEPSSSLYASSHNKSHGSFNGWMAVPWVNVSPSWLQRSSRWTALLLLAAMVPNSMLRRRTSIARVAIQYQFRSWKEFVIATWAHAILFLLFSTLSGVSVYTTEDPSPWCKPCPKRFGEMLWLCNFFIFFFGRVPFYRRHRTARFCVVHHFICMAFSAIWLLWDDFGVMTEQGCHA